MENRETVLELILKVKETYPDKNIWIYSGSTVEELLSRQDKVTNEILKNVNTLVDGRFVEELKDLKLKFRGSSNQRILNMEEYFKMKKEANLEENIKILIHQGINYLSNQLEALDTNNDNLKNIQFLEYLYRNSPLIATEIIDKMLDDNKIQKYVQKITDTFDYIKLYFYEKYETAIGANFATNEEVKIVFYEYLNMLSNNTEELSTSHTLKGTSVFYEMFTNWCEDGEIFRSRAEDKEISESSANRCILLMNHF